MARWSRFLAGTVLVLAFLPAATAAARPDIVGGTLATRPYPFAAFVELHYAGAGAPVGYCGGSLVAARYVVTAGHCLEDAPTRIDVTVGDAHVDHDTATALEYQGVASARYPGFAIVGDEPVDDVAVLTLPTPAPEAQVRLPRISDAGMWAPGAGGTAVGWGRCGAFDGCAWLPDDLREVAQPLRADSSCAARFRFEPASMLCAGGELGKDTCSGDSGGALLVDDGFGAPVLAGATSFGSDACGDGTPAVYTRIGGSALNTWLRTIVPQVEVDASTATPAPGDAVTFTALPRRPGGGGPFGGYDGLAWDLDGDGAFAEGEGRTSVERTMTAGVNAVSVRATSAAGDAEVRTIRVRTIDRATVSFASGLVGVREGHTALLTIDRAGTGAGTVTVTPGSIDARAVGLRPADAQTLAFGQADTRRTVAFTAPDDRRTEPTETYRVTLGGFTGALTPGPATTALVAVLDDDPSVRLTASRRLRRGRVALDLRADRAGRFTVKGSAGGRAVTRRGSLRLRRAGHRALRVRLTSRARRALAARGRLKVRVAATFDPAADGVRTVTVRRTVTLRAAR